jgi:AcrR family transcriptional regulator
VAAAATLRSRSGLHTTRGSARYQAIIDAALDVLIEVGYERLTIDAVAARAHASKATIYRGWKGKAELVAEAVRQWPGAQFEPPDTGTLRGDLQHMLGLLRKRLHTKHGRLFSGLVEAIQHDPVLAETIQANTHCHAKMAYQKIIDRAVDRNEISAEVDTELVMTIAPAVMCFHHLYTGDPVNDRLVQRLIDDILIPLLCRESTTRRPAHRRNTMKKGDFTA